MIRLIFLKPPHWRLTSGSCTFSAPRMFQKVAPMAVCVPSDLSPPASKTREPQPSHKLVKRLRKGADRWRSRFMSMAVLLMTTAPCSVPDREMSCTKRTVELKLWWEGTRARSGERQLDSPALTHEQRDDPSSIPNPTVALLRHTTRLQPRHIPNDVCPGTYRLESCVWQQTSLTAIIEQ